MEDARVLLSRNLALLINGGKDERAAQVCREDLTKFLGAHRSETIEMWENGDMMPPWDKLHKIADFFGVSVSNLFCEDPEVMRQRKEDRENTVQELKNTIAVLRENLEIAKRRLEDPEPGELLEADRHEWVRDFKEAGVKEIVLRL